MKKLTILLSASLIAISTTSLGGCALTTAGVKKGDERNFARSLNDVNASRAIRARFTRAEGFKLGGVDVEAAQGIVLLSGNVPRQEDRIEAERIAWSAPKVMQVGNEIMIKGKQGIVRNTKDGVLNKAVRARLTANGNIKARNYNVEVHDGIVYLLGVARTPEELEQATYMASTTRGAREVISYVRVAGDNSSQYASGPGYNGQPSNVASAPAYIPNTGSTPSPSYSAPTAPVYSSPLPQAAQPMAPDAIESGEPYYLDPQTGQRVEIPEGVKPIPYVPDTPGSLGAGGSPLPPGAQPSQILGEDLPPIADGGSAFPTDDQLGKYRTGAPGEAVSVIESAPYMLDPDTGEMIPVKYVTDPNTGLITPVKF
jgi:osmotically-inducible protein OsmY